MAKNSDRVKYFDFQEQEDEYVLNNYGVKIKNRAGKKPANQKFTEKREKELRND